MLRALCAGRALLGRTATPHHHALAQREFRLSVVCMGRRSAKIANRKVCGEAALQAGFDAAAEPRWGPARGRGTARTRRRARAAAAAALCGWCCHPFVSRSLSSHPPPPRQGKEDVARGKLYGRIGKQIQMAVKAGGSSENSNTALASVLAMARLNNVPKDIVERNLKAGDSKDYTEYTYEARQASTDEVAEERRRRLPRLRPPNLTHPLSLISLPQVYGFGGVGLVLDVLTDSANRAAAAVRSTVLKKGGKMADPGSVLFGFSRRGRVVLSGGEEEAVLAAAADAGADDVQPREGGGQPGWEVTCAAGDFGAVASALRAAGLPLVGDASGLVLVPLSRVAVDDAAAESNEALVDALLQLDDVDAVVTNEEEEDGD